ncbi:hypothetical protein BDC45DRAFT_509181 [Circinella umbellata]|nr:hypothetical protein BDC45DRAFT_509181 [Circinella umbellata]
MQTTTKHSVRKSCSDTTPNNKAPLVSTQKRRSLGSVKPPTTNTCNKQNDKHVWRSPGYCEIPDILGKAYLQPLPIEPKQVIRKKSIIETINNSPARPPWVPARCTANWSPPPPPPIVRHEESGFLKRLKKAIPKITFIELPKNRYIGSKEIGTG